MAADFALAPICAPDVKRSIAVNCFFRLTDSMIKQGNADLYI